MANKNGGEPGKPFAGKVALVTGSATRIGEAIVRRLGGEGAIVIVHGRPEEYEATQTIAREIKEASMETLRSFVRRSNMPTSANGLLTKSSAGGVAWICWSIMPSPLFAVIMREGLPAN